MESVVLFASQMNSPRPVPQRRDGELGSIGQAASVDRFERFVLRAYATRALMGEGSTTAKRPPRSLAAWLHVHGNLIGAPEPQIDPDKVEEGFGRVDRETWAAFAPMVARLRKAVKAPPPSGLERRLNWICETLSLSVVESDLLKASVRLALLKPVTALVASLDGSGGRFGEAGVAGLAVLTGHSHRVVREALTPGASLRVLGLLEARGGDEFAASNIVLRIARLGTTDPERLKNLLMGRPGKAQLDWEDFAHLGENAELVAQLLAGALARRAKGVNILLHGEPGTGKTEFARTLAARLGAHPIFVGETDEDNGEPERGERIAAFALASALAGRAGRALLVVDEAEDIFAGVDAHNAPARRGSKVFMNRLVERTEAPTVWITNHPDSLGPAVLRRMALAIRFPQPGRAVRRRLVERIMSRRRLGLSPAAVDQLAEIKVAPAIIDNAMRVAKLTGCREDGVGLAVRSLQQVIDGPAAPPSLGGVIPFDPVLSSADHDLVRLADRVSQAGELAVTFCLHGPPGTGKSAYARYLAQRMGIDVVEKRASDLLSMWVGGTEKRIAEAFQEAADRRAMLILDEADSLLRDRAGARASWEVSQVNEMLAWLERHPYPVACTTNLMESLDPATLRRFLFKIRFLPMTATQASEAFRRSFGGEPPTGTADLNPLTPGDFAVVTRKARLLGEHCPDALAALLAQEVAAKPGARLGRVGF
jgi:transitional endoplasmic reticulum ATPase